MKSLVHEGAGIFFFLYCCKLTDSGYSDVNAKVCGCSAIFYAAFYGRNEMINFLFDLEADLDSTNLNGETALFWAVEREQYSSVELLLNKGAKVSIVDQKGFTGNWNFQFHFC